MEFYGEEGREGSLFGVMCMYVGIGVKCISKYAYFWFGHESALS